MTDAIDVSLAGIDLGDWDIEGLSEWWDLAAARSRAQDRPVGDGRFEEPYLDREAIRPTATLHFKGSSPAQASATLTAMRKVVGRVPVELIVDDGTGPRMRRVEVHRVTVAARFEWWNLPVVIDMLAPDPLLYGLPKSATTGLPTPGSGMTWPIVWPLDWGTPGNPGRLVVDNTDGTAETWPDMRVSLGGLSSGFQIVELETGRRLRFQQQVQEPWVIDLLPRIGRARVDGSGDVTTALKVREWPLVPAGEFRTYAFESLGASSGTPTLTASWSPAFI